ncbi:MAG: dockerin type I repeat-containing protein [Ruminococcus sp.]|nr:dockerin type I repeat-containing protein [Ruminococcus sp.]
MKKNKIKTLSFILIMVLLLGIVSVSGMSVSEIDPDNKYKYEEMVIPKALPVDDGEEPNWEILYYRESYEYYSCEDASTNDEATPDYVMAKVFLNPVPDILVHSYFGEYVISTGPYSPYLHGYHIYVPAEDKVYTLEEAYNSGVHGIEEALKFLSVEVAIVGDCDGNYEVNVKDATYVQKYIAELDVPSHSFWEPEFVFDFNKDESVNIKDATAIQKHIAGLPY